MVGVALLDEVAHRDRVRLEPDARCSSERTRLAREDEPAPVPVVVEGLDPESIAGAEELPGEAVPESERPHAVEALDTGLAPLLVGGEDDLGVRCAAEGPAGALELGP